MSTYIPGIILIVLGLVLAVLTAKGYSLDRRVTWILAGFFLILGIGVCVIMYFEAYQWYYLVIGVPFFGFMLWIGGSLVKDCIVYSGRTEGTFLEAVKDHKDRHGTQYYSLKFKYRANGKTYQKTTNDTYILHDIEKRCVPDMVYPIRFNPGHPDQIRIRRFHGFVSGILAMLVAFCGLYGVFAYLIKGTL